MVQIFGQIRIYHYTDRNIYIVPRLSPKYINMSTVDSDFILGFIAGEGSFSAAFRKSPSSKHNVHPLITFRLMLSDSDEALLRYIGDEVGIGDVKTDSLGRVYWHVDSYEDRETLIEWIDSRESEMWQKSQKYGAYTRWKAFHETYGYHERRDAEEIKDLIDLSRTINHEGRKQDRTPAQLKAMVDGGV